MRGPPGDGELHDRVVDWIHRELWLCDDGLLLVWIPAEAIVAASGRRGRMADRLSLDLRDGARRKLLWMSVDRSDVPLTAALSAWGVEPTSAGAFG